MPIPVPVEEVAPVVPTALAASSAMVAEFLPRSALATLPYPILAKYDGATPHSPEDAPSPTLRQTRRRQRP